jgi:hypothetical protein
MVELTKLDLVARVELPRFPWLLPHRFFRAADWSRWGVLWQDAIEGWSWAELQLGVDVLARDLHECATEEQAVQELQRALDAPR